MSTSVDHTLASGPEADASITGETCGSDQRPTAPPTDGTGPTPVPTSPVQPATGRRGLARGTAVDRYTILSMIGRGGMSEVYAAYDPQLDRKIALKLLRPRASSGAEAPQSRLVREARAIAQISHPNVITVYDVGTFDDRVFVAIEYVEGQTLLAWLNERPRSVAEILAMFADAARGLAAAHAKGLVHRDFKPHNALVGRDGIVRVADFGLARWSDETSFGPDTGPLPTPRPADGDLTRTGDILGTPLYMAPEQLRGAAVDARADQFSFCVTLHHALYGHHPALVDGRAIDRPSINGPDETPTPPSPRGPVPVRVRRAILRGLAVAPDERWPSMTELLAALEGPGVKPPRRVMFSVVSLALVGGVALAAAPQLRPRSDPCAGGAARVGGVWTGKGTDVSPDTRHLAVRSAFAATGVKNASEIWERVAARLDRYASSWTQTYREVCQASLERGEPLDPGINRHLGCLEERRWALNALVDELITADRVTMTRAVDGAIALPSLDLCMGTPAPPPEAAGAEQRARADDLRRRALVARVLYNTGRDGQAIAQGKVLLAEARTLAYPPLEAELLDMIGAFQAKVFDPEAPVTLEAAVWRALGAGRNELAAEAAILLAGIVSYHQRRPEEGERWRKLAVALVDGLGREHDYLRAWLLNDRATLLMEAHHPEEALRVSREALALKRKILPSDHPDIGRSLVGLSLILDALGDDRAAIETADQARRQFERAYGSDDLLVGQAIGNRAEFEAKLGRTADALASFHEALRRWRPRVAPDNQFLAIPLTGLGRALLSLGRPEEAVPPLEQAWRIRESREPDPTLRAQTELALAQALAATGQKTRARTLAKDARAQARRAAGEAEPGNGTGHHRARRGG